MNFIQTQLTVRIYFSLVLILIQFLSFGQNSFQSLKQDLEHKIVYSNFRKALEIINKNRERYNDAEKNDLDVIKAKILTEFGLYDEAFKLSQHLIVNSQITEEQKLKIHFEKALIYEINEENKYCLSELQKVEALLLKHTKLKS